jgi:peptide/nickel transport system substrate-binding protein
MGAPSEQVGIDRRQFVRLAAGAAAFGSVGLLSACGDGATGTGTAAPGSARRGGTMEISLAGGGAKETLDPAKTVSITEAILSGALYEGLVRIKRSDWSAQPLLATTWRSNADLTEWRFHLRDGVRFHDGSPLRAHDVVYTIRRVLDPKVGSIIFARLSTVLDPDGVTAPSRNEVVFKLRQPDAFFPIAIGARHAKIVPEGTEDFARAPGTGPFKLERFAPGQGYEIAKHAQYWNPELPKLDALKCTYGSEQSTLVQSVLSGEAHFGGSLDYSTVPTVKGNAGAVLLPDEGALFADIVADPRHAPFDDVRVRRALKLSLDRKRVRDVVQQGYGVLTSDVPVRGNDTFFPKSLGVRAQQLDKARQLLADAGHPDGVDVTLTTSSVGPGMVDLATIVAEQAKDAGFRITVRQRPADTYFDREYMKDPFFVTYWILRHPFDAMSVVFRSDSPVNESRFKSPRLDALLTKAQRSADAAEQRAALGEAQTLVADNAGWICPTFGSALYVHKPQVRGVGFNPTDIVNFENATIA